MSIPESSLPPITLCTADAERLWALSEVGRRQSPEVADFLEGELERARILPDDALPGNFVRMGSRVSFRDDGTGLTTHVVLVYPGEEDTERRHVSILSPVGAALIGLSPGQSIVFTTSQGRRRKLTLLTVEQQGSDETVGTP
ncbi:MAG: nucleoside diphosphate kinase regulator [Magnetospirillum sp.]|nr:nucleoside diphosphate kinase regulator [Magnetospirillum sp.]